MAASVTINFETLDEASANFSRALRTLTGSLEVAARHIENAMRRVGPAAQAGGPPSQAGGGGGILNSAIGFTVAMADVQVMAKAMGTATGNLKSIAKIAGDAGISAADLQARLSGVRETLETRPAAVAALKDLGIEVDNKSGLRDTVRILADLGKAMASVSPAQAKAYAENLGIDPDVVRLLRDDGTRAQLHDLMIKNADHDSFAEHSLSARNSIGDIGDAADRAGSILGAGFMEPFAGALKRFRETADRRLPELADTLSLVPRAVGLVSGAVVDVGNGLLEVVGRANEATNGASTYLGLAATTKTGRAVIGRAAASGWSLGRAAIAVPGIGALIGVATAAAAGREYQNSEEGLQSTIASINERIQERKIYISRESDSDAAVARYQSEIEPFVTKRSELEKELAAVREKDWLPVDALLLKGSMHRSVIGGLGLDMDQRSADGLTADPSLWGQAAARSLGSDLTADPNRMMLIRDPISINSTNNITVSGVLDPLAVAQHIAAVQIEVNNNLMRSNTGGQVA
ncbi:hypothetical protein CEG14_15565 [Bordetella genomosp. 1]|uniref:Uncharacterized protein n=1 Tax=Bordetella genomosp. 1 TaxID=1395607 RepID=A0A261SGY2_9BORD|nr:hypothetical protein [Bordetella genomosp. 1]OZI36415.1 hypothetical protein CEG14_15565 [Bordetella genomosp. 1]